MSSNNESSPSAPTSAEDRAPTTEAPVDTPVEGVWIDRQSGTGSLSRQEAWSASHARRSPNDGRSSTRTTFYYDTKDERLASRGILKSDGDRRSYSDLAKWNDDMWAPERASQNEAAFRRRFAALVCAQLDVAPHHADRVEHLVDDMAFGDLCVYSYTSEVIILALVSLVVEQDMAVDDDVDLTEDWIVHRDEFRNLMADLGVDGPKLWDARERIVELTEHF